MNRLHNLWAIVCAAGLLAGTLGHAATVITLDGTVGPSGTVQPIGSVYTIDASVGATRGNNLFHSFGQFGLSQGDTANFTGPANIQNIITRVTGGSASSIDGTIQSSIQGANFFFINPFGVMFGPHAQLNVSGSFAATTADYIKLADGGRFDARTHANDILTAAPVSAFGFLPGNLGAIALHQSVLALPERSTFSLIGGDMNMDGASITAPSGRINVISIKPNGELSLDVTDINAPVDTSGFAELGAVTLDSTFLGVSGDRGGQILIDAERVAMPGTSTLEAINLGSEPGLGIELNVRGSLQMDGALLQAFAFGQGDGGSVILKAGSIDMENASAIQTVTAPLDPLGSGRAGDIIIQTGSLIMGYSAQMTATTASPASGGNIEITAPKIQMNQFASLESLTAAEGTAGNIIIHTDSLTMALNSQISTVTLGPAAGGKIQITASTIHIDGKGQGDTPTGIFAGAPADFGPDTGRGGDITIHTGLLDVRNGAQISSSSQTSGDGGMVHIDAQNLTLDAGASIACAASSSGKAGGIVLHVAGNLLLKGDSSVSVASSQSQGGNIDIVDGSTIRLIESQITAQAADDGGNIRLTAPLLIYLLDSRLTAAAGNNGGNVTIDPPVVVLNHSLISANAINGAGGRIEITAAGYLPSADSSVTASSEFGVQGTVAINSPQADLAGKLLGLPSTLLDAESLLKPHCSVRLPRGVSSFILTGSGGAPVEPDGLLPALPVLPTQ